jgi:hypothetical protein
MSHRSALARCALLAVLSACGAQDSAVPGNLLRNAKLIEARNVRDAERLLDGRTAREGDSWQSDLSAVFETRSARVVIDLGGSRSVDALFVVGDNNDRFDFALSEDNQRYTPLWRSDTADRPGMRARSSGQLGGRGRYLRITALGGDNFVSAAEVIAFERTPEPFPPRVGRVSSGSVHAAEQHKALLASAGLALALLLTLARLPAFCAWLGVLLAFATTYALARELAPKWPLHAEIVSYVRVLLALLAALGLVLARAAEGAWSRRAPLIAQLTLLALLSVGTFYNYGRPWFLDFQKGRPTPVHTFDMRVYYPVAKYFDELRFDGLYFASVAAYLEGQKLPASAVADTNLRDLRNNKMVKARDVMPEIERIHERFSPERWRSFIEDMRYFWQAMRYQYLETLIDHGGNATPAWIAIAHLLFAPTDASERVLTLTGLFDPLFVLLIGVCVWRSFGAFTALACLIVFGATDFPMLGSNWAGATLRFDWMAGMALGACAFRTGRYALGGGLLGYAAMMRAFPALSIALIGGALALELLRFVRSARRLPTLAELRAEHRPALTALLSAFIVCGALFSLSVGLFGVKPWGQWAHKIEIHNQKSNTNHVGLRTALSFHPDRVPGKLAGPDPWLRWDEAQRSTFAERKPLFILAALAFIAAAIYACAGAPLERAAVLGLVLVPVLSYPANYYMHAIFILPIAAAALATRRKILAELVLFALCVVQYRTTLPMGGDMRFFWQSVILLSAIVLLLALLVWDRAKTPKPAHE